MGNVIDIAIGVLVVEAVAFTAIGPLRKILPAIALLPNFAAGLALMLALRFAGGIEGSPWVTAFLGVAGVAHVIDLALRLRRTPDRSSHDRHAP